MKNIQFFISILLISFVMSSKLAAQKASHSIVGIWEIREESKILGYFDFSEDGLIYFDIENFILDGRNFEIKGGENEGRTAQIKYQLEKAKSDYDLILIGMIEDKLIKKERFAKVKFITPEKVHFEFRDIHSDSQSTTEVLIGNRLEDYPPQ